MEAIKRSVVARGWGKRGINRQSTEGFSVSKITLYDTIVVDICHPTLV